MTFAEAIAAIQAGSRVSNSTGSVFWLEHDSKGRPVLMGEPAGYGKSVKHVVFASEHFSGQLDWSITKD
jgi:hypothetical protein